MCVVGKSLALRVPFVPWKDKIMQSLMLAGNFRPAKYLIPGQRLLPGLLLTFILAAVEFELRNLLGITALSPLIIAIVLGMVFHNTMGTPDTFKPGVVFSM